MWKEYSLSYIKKNKTVSVFIALSVLIASLFISTLLTLFYNVYIDEINRSGNMEIRALVVIYIGIFISVCFSLMLIIRSVFQFSMNARIHQLGILGSVGATPKQIRTVLLQEALVLSAVPIFIGTSIGILICAAFVRYANTFNAQLGNVQVVFQYHFLLFAVTVISILVTLLISALQPALKLSRINPLQAIKGDHERASKHVKKFRVASLIWGIEGELARKSLYTRRKALRTATFCFTVSFLVVTVFLNLMTVSELSVKHSLVDQTEEILRNAEIYSAYKHVTSAFCGLLGLIGVANVFANTLGFVYQRKREFARYQSVGLTPEGMTKMLFIEALILGVKPMLIGIPLNVLFVFYAVSSTKVTAQEYVQNMPLGISFLFAFIMLSSVGISYYVGGKRLMKISIAENLKNDALFG